MTRKEAAIIAETLEKHTAGQDWDQYVRLCREMATALELGTRKFDRKAFLEKCGVPT